jgi:hypothetical protein
MKLNSGLKTAFRFNALFSVGCAALLLILAEWWAIQFGLQDPLYIQLGAVGLIIFAVYLAWLSITKQQPKASIVGVIISDWGYVAAALSGVIFAFSALSVEALLFLCLTSVVVATAAEWQRRAAFC